MLQLRDTDDVRALAARLNTARRVLLVGNGGSALELVCVPRERGLARGPSSELRLLRSDALNAQARHEVVWAVRHGSIGDAFFDRDAVRRAGGRSACWF